MRKIFSILALALILFTSCSKLEYSNLGEEKQWIQFETAAYSVSEAATTSVKIPVLYAAKSNPNGVTINFTLTSNNPAGYSFSPSNGQLTIPAGEFKGFIEVTPINNLTAAADKSDLKVTLSLAGNTIASGLAGEGVYFATTELSIIEDDCPFILSEFVGTYNALEVGYVDSSGKQILYDIKATLGTEANTLILENVWDVKGKSTVTFDYSDPANPRIKFKSGELLYTDPSQGPITIHDLTDLTPPDLTTPSIFKVCNKQMELYFKAKDGSGAFSPKAHITLTKK